MFLSVNEEIMSRYCDLKQLRSSTDGWNQEASDSTSTQHPALKLQDSFIHSFIPAALLMMHRRFGSIRMCVYGLFVHLSSLIRPDLPSVTNLRLHHNNKSSSCFSMFPWNQIILVKTLIISFTSGFQMIFCLLSSKWGFSQHRRNDQLQPTTETSPTGNLKISKSLPLLGSISEFFNVKQHM